jgi:hypothetical protein
MQPRYFTVPSELAWAGPAQVHQSNDGELFMMNRHQHQPAATLVLVLGTQPRLVPPQQCSTKQMASKSMVHLHCAHVGFAKASSAAARAYVRLAKPFAARAVGEWHSAYLTRQIWRVF